MLRHAPASPDVIGIRSVLKPGKGADVVLVHGMCFHDKQWVQDANDNLADALGWHRITNLSNGVPVGRYGGMLYENALSGPSGERVRTYAILWSQVSAGARVQLCYDTNAPTESCPDATAHIGDTRAAANALLKNQIMDGCLSDAVYAVGADGIERIGSTIEAGLTLALAGGHPLAPEAELTLAPLQDQTAPLFVVTESLGSKLFVDAAIRMASRSCEALTSMAVVMRRTVQIFIEANQLPILSLAYNPQLMNKCPAVSGAEPRTGLTGFEALAQLRKARLRPQEGLATPLKVVAFSDPNDVLSYTLVPASNLPQGLEVADVVLANDWSWLGFFENPYSAHTTYGSKCRVHHVIADGTAGLAMPCGLLQ